MGALAAPRRVAADPSMCGGGRLMLSFLHLTVFETLLRLKSVTQAAEALDLPQPTLSRHLKYLRSHFDNPLFVRTSKGLEPTAMAMSLAGAISADRKSVVQGKRVSVRVNHG